MKVVLPGLRLVLSGLVGVSALGLYVGCTTGSGVRNASVGASSERQPADTATLVTTDNFRLLPDEHWYGGSQELELQRFQDIGRQVVAAQVGLQKQMKNSPKERVFHAKQTACLIGHLSISSANASDAQRAAFSGMFTEGRNYTVLARYSNGVGITRTDDFPDVRGFSIKILNVEDEADHSLKAVDIPMTDSPVAFGKDIGEFVEFMNASANPGFASVNVTKYFAKYPAVFHALNKALVKFDQNPAKMNFWSGNPFLMNGNHAFKFNVRPEAGGDQPINKALAENLSSNSSLSSKVQAYVENKWEGVESVLGPNATHDSISETLSRGGIRYIASIQLDVDPDKTPIGDAVTSRHPEGAMEEWTEANSPSIPVGVLDFPPQNIDDPQLQEICHSARFTPGHYVSQHRPLGNVGRGRIFAYQASANGRGASATEVNEQVVLKILDQVKQ